MCTVFVYIKHAELLGNRSKGARIKPSECALKRKPKVYMFIN
jgi:hypothetical protein